MKFIINLLLVFIISLGYSDIKFAEDICADHKGIYQIELTVEISVVMCNDNTLFFIAKQEKDNESQHDFTIRNSHQRGSRE